VGIESTNSVLERTKIFRGLDPTTTVFGLILFTSAIYYFSYLLLVGVKEDEVGRAYSTNGGEEECIKDIGGKARRKDTTIKTNNIKMDLREIGWNGMDWIDLAQDRDQWRALVNTVMNLRVP
jgi:hypothetical protein